MDPTDPGTGEDAPDPLEIVSFRVRHLTPYRAVIKWRTNEMANSAVIDGDHRGTKDHAVKRHRMFVPGQPGQVKMITIFSEAADGTEASKDIVLTYGAVQH
jgi:hypothetical protein